MSQVPQSHQMILHKQSVAPSLAEVYNPLEVLQFRKEQRNHPKGMVGTKKKKKKKR